MSVLDAAQLKARLARHGLRADKSLGQHFLVSRPAVESIVGALDGCDGILEIGPGPGVLTGLILESRSHVAAVELDPRMVKLWPRSFPSLQVVEADALKADLDGILSNLPKPTGLVSNLPYYITGPLLARVADVRSHLDRAVLMMQREVAHKILAPPGSSLRGSLSVCLQIQFDIQRLTEVPAGAFLPPPKVDSTVLALRPRPVEPNEPKLLALVRQGFSQPRKTLANNLAGLPGATRQDVQAWIERAELRPDVRPHLLDEVAWRSLQASRDATNVS